MSTAGLGILLATAPGWTEITVSPSRNGAALKMIQPRIPVKAFRTAATAPSQVVTVSPRRVASPRAGASVRLAGTRRPTRSGA